MRIRGISLALVAVLGVGACGNGGDEGDDQALSTTTTAGSPGAPSATSAPGPADDQAVVDRIVLKASDFPPGWTSTPAEPDAGDAGDKALAECLGVPLPENRPEAESPEFSRGELTQVSSSAELAATEEEAASEFAALEGPKANPCFKQQFDKALAEQAGDVTFAPAEIEVLEPPTAGDEALALRLTTGISAPDGSTVAIYADFVFIRKGRAEISLSFINAGQPFDSALAGGLTQKLASRA